MRGRLTATLLLCNRWQLMVGADMIARAGAVAT